MLLFVYFAMQEGKTTTYIPDLISNIMEKQDAIKIFEDKKVRGVWDGEQEKWYFSIIDVIEVLTNSDRPRKYWSDLKAKLKKEGSQLSEKIGQLKMRSADGKAYKTDVADTEIVKSLTSSFYPEALSCCC